MKKCLLFTTLLFLSYILNAQVGELEKTFRDSFREGNIIVKESPDSGIVILGTLTDDSPGGWPSSEMTVRKLSAEGEELFSLSPLDNSYGMFFSTNVEVSQNNHIYVIGYYGGCDYFGQNVLIKLDGNTGAMLWEILLDFEPYNKTIVSHHEDGVWLNEANYIFHINSLGERIDSIYFFNNTNTIDYFDIASSTGQVVMNIEDKLVYRQNYNNPWAVNNAPSNGHLFLLDSGFIEASTTVIKKYNSTASPIADTNVNIDASAWNNQPKRIDVFNELNLLAFLGADSSIYFHNLDLDFIKKIDWHYGGEISELRFLNNKLGISGSKQFHTYLKYIDVSDSIINKEYDVEILDVIVDETIKSNCNTIEYLCTYCSYDVNGIQVVIKNNSIDTLHYAELSLSVYDPCSFICSTYSRFLNTYSDLTIAPNDTDTLIFDDFIIPRQYTNWTELCLLISRPNYRMDYDFENDYKCGILNIETSLEEIVSRFSLYPNPTTNTLYIDIENLSQIKLKMYDRFGRMYSIEAGKNNISHLPSGAYYIELTDGHKRHVEPFIKL